MKRQRFSPDSPWVVAACLVACLTAWIPCVHLLFRSTPASIYSQEGIPEKARAMAERHLELWQNPETRRQEIQSMRGSNAEWDFTGRTFLVLSLGEMIFRDPALKARLLPVMDAIIEETVKIEAEKGIHTFLMPYSKSRPFIVSPARSLFVDSEIAAMIGARRMVEDKQAFREEFRQRIAAMRERLEMNGAMAVESYPDECWLFDHGMAIAAFRMSDHLDRTDHSRLRKAWLAKAREKLTHAESGLLVSSYTTKGEPLDGPEGSSIWFAIHCLRLVDEGFAREQYARAKTHLARSLGGFGWSREWPSSWKGPTDIDSGAVIPILEVSAGGSGLAFIAASTLGDEEFFAALHRTLDFAAFPKRDKQALRYCASNQVGDSVMLYSMVLGPMWKRLEGTTP